jgi:hypothetical protein
MDGYQNEKEKNNENKENEKFEEIQLMSNELNAE